MNAGFRPGTGCRWRWGLPSTSLSLRRTRGAGLWMLSLLLLAAFPAGASVLYRCVGPHGATAFVSHTRGYTHCVQVGAWHTHAARPKRLRHPAAVTHRSAHAKTLPGMPPRPAKANPAVLKIIPLAAPDSISVHKLPRSRVWQPLPVAVLDALGRQVLPDLLGMAEPPAKPAATASAKAPASIAALQPSNKEDASVHKRARRGAVYRVPQKNGGVLYTNIAALAKGRHARKLFTYLIRCYACNVHSKIDWNTVPLQLAAYRHDIHAASKHTGVDPALLRAVIHAESGFDPRALSYKGAQGLMQLMPSTAFALGVGDAFDPAQNISAGARYLAELLKHYHGNARLAAAAYNAGENAVKKYGGVPPYAETRVYVHRVGLLYRRYHQALGEKGAVDLAAATAAK